MYNENELKQIENSRVLIVDDLPISLEILGGFLKDYGLELYFAENGHEAIEIAEKKLPELILLDIEMPDLNGFEVCEKLKDNASTSKIPIVFLTANKETDFIIKGFQLGAVDYITKPFNQEELLARMFTHLKLQKFTETITEQNRLLKDLNSEKDKLFSIIAHDLKGPFSSTMSAFDLVIENYDLWDSNKKLSWLKEMQKSTQKTLSLLDNLLIWARSQTGHMKINQKLLNLVSITSEIIALFNETSKNKNIKLKSKIENDIYVFADSNMVSTIIRNLLSNAIKYSKENSTVIIDSAQQGEFFCVSISDEGVGMEVEKVGKLFKIEKNQSTPGTKGERGTGLGLILCKDFVQKLGGRIWVESTSGKGSKFSFTLPQYK